MRNLWVQAGDTACSARMAVERSDFVCGYRCARSPPGRRDLHSHVVLCRSRLPGVTSCAIYWCKLAIQPVRRERRPNDRISFVAAVAPGHRPAGGTYVRRSVICRSRLPGVTSCAIYWCKLAIHPARRERLSSNRISFVAAAAPGQRPAGGTYLRRSVICRSRLPGVTSCAIYWCKLAIRPARRERLSNDRVSFAAAAAAPGRRPAGGTYIRMLSFV